MVKKGHYVFASTKLASSGMLLRFGDTEGIFEHLLDIAKKIEPDIENLFHGLNLNDCPNDKVCDFAKETIDLLENEVDSTNENRENLAWPSNSTRLVAVRRIMRELQSG